jgi:hypothetical protein
MRAQTTTDEPVLSVEQLKSLGAGDGPCITVVFPMRVGPTDNRKPSIRFKRELHSVDEKLTERGVKSSDRNELMAPLLSLAEILDGEADRTGSLVLFRSSSVSRWFFVDEAIEGSCTVADHFNVRPILPLIGADRTFYVLALSQKNIRLMRCNERDSVEIPLPEATPKSFESWLNVRSPQSPPNHGESRASAEAGPEGSFTSVTDRDNLDSHLRNFYKEVNKGVVEVLKDDKAPLVLAGVEYEIPIFKDVNTHPNLVGTPVLGAPDGLKGGELHRRALEAVQPHFQKDLENALQAFEKLGGSDRVSTGIKEIVRGAYDGRVAHLFVARTAQRSGQYDEASHKVVVHHEQHPEDEDLINAAALQTLLHGGQVFVLSRSKTPKGADLAAVLRW